MNHRRGRRLITAGGGLLVVVGLAYFWLHRDSAPPPPEPPQIAEIADEEVRQAVDKARQEVLAQPEADATWGYYGMVLLAHLFDREADRCFEQAARLGPQVPLWPYARGLIALKRDPDVAIERLREAVDRAAPLPAYAGPMRLQLAEALLERQELDEAESLFRAELRREPGSARASLGLALVDLQQQRLEAAHERLMRARSSPYAHKAATVQLARLARLRGEASQAEKWESEAAALEDDAPWPDPLLDRTARLQVGIRGREREADRLEREDRYAEAAEAYRQLHRRQPSAQSCIGAGINLARIGRYDEAIPLLREAVERAPQSSQAHYSLALVHYTQAEAMTNPAERRPHLEAALRHAEQATQRKPDHFQAWLFTGLALLQLGRPSEAIAPLQQGLTCRPGNEELHLALGQAFAATGQFAPARQHLTRAAELAPNDPRVRAALAALPPPA